jgi:hypothetical protein
MQRTFTIISAAAAAVNPSHLLALSLQRLDGSQSMRRRGFDYNHEQAWRYFSIACG